MGSLLGLTLYNWNLKEQMVQDKDLSLQSTISRCRSQEMTWSQMQVILEKGRACGGKGKCMWWKREVHVVEKRQIMWWKRDVHVVEKRSACGGKGKCMWWKREVHVVEK